ncbi:MAG TPA: hypothetical protein DEB40_13820 [Elusimicrobia bacterium]|nr:hypothetical protein [Elusimicrobiota bacterium]HBT62811.1 hypothetical protein [Elusimicrobiota bacterium]
MFPLVVIAVAGVFGASSKPSDAPLLQEDITIKGKKAGGPRLKMPAAAADDAVIREVVDSLDVIRKEPDSHVVKVPLDATAKRLSAPYPRAPFVVFSLKKILDYDEWDFQLLDDERVIFRIKGSLESAERVEWDGRDDADRMAAVAGRSYHFRFSGSKKGEEYVLESESVALNSLSFLDFSGQEHLEVSNSQLFYENEHNFLPQAARYIEALADRMCRITPSQGRYQLTLYQPKPRSSLARKRAQILSKNLSKRLLIAESRLPIEILPVAERGDVLAVILPAN